jgi:membrane-bound lytic murein transglycosylase F
MKTLFKFLIFIFILWGCKTDKFEKENIGDAKHRQLDHILQSDTLKAITTYSGTTYFLYRGEPMGFEYEILKEFAKYLDVHLEMVVAKDENKLIEMLNNNEGDLIAYGFTLTNERQEQIDFSIPLYTSYQVLVQRKPDNWRRLKLHQIKKRLVTNTVQLLGDTVFVKKNSSYQERLENLNNEIGGNIKIDTIPGDMTTDEIFKNISNGSIKNTITDQNIASLYVSDYPNLDISMKMSFSQRIGWGLRKSSTKLKDTLNQWLKKYRKTLDYNVTYNKYFKNKRSFRRRVKSEFYSLNEKKISPFDNLFKKYADSIGWDWRLLTSVGYQESKFLTSDESWSGAMGIMQIMPSTAEYLNISDPTDPEQSIRGASQYLSELYEYFDNVKDSIQRQKFTLASYNAGYAHIKDAQKMAEYLKLDPLQWDNNVEEALLKLDKPEFYKMNFIKSGFVRAKQPYYYVREIFDRYKHYKTFYSKITTEN